MKDSPKLKIIDINGYVLETDFYEYNIDKQPSVEQFYLNSPYTTMQYSNVVMTFSCYIGSLNLTIKIDSSDIEDFNPVEYGYELKLRTPLIKNEQQNEQSTEKKEFPYIRKITL